MPKCEYCGKEISVLPFKCKYCGKTFCAEHRLPENHDCEGLKGVSPESLKSGKKERTIEDELEELEEIPFQDEPRVTFRVERVPEERRRSEKGGGGLSGLLKNLFFRQATMVLLLLMFLAFVAQQAAYVLFGGGYLGWVAPTRATLLSRPWTLVTSIFIHDGFGHWLINSMVLFFIGPALETKIGRSKFVYIFLGAGAIAAFSQLLFMASTPYHAVAGASGAIFGILGTLTALAPNLPILLFFFIPMRLWMLTVGYGAFEVMLELTGLWPTVGHIAHLSGLVIGAIYGLKLHQDIKQSYSHPLQSFIEGPD